MEIVSKCGNILDHFTTSIWISNQLGATGIEALTVACTPIGGAVIGLQAIGIGLLAWRLYEIQNYWTFLDTGECEGADPLEEYNADVNPFEYHRKRLFNIVTIAQEELLNGITGYNQYDLLKDHIFQKSVQTSIQIALMIIGLVGVGLLIFAGVAASPIAWGILGAVGIVSLATLIGSIYKENAFNQALIELAG